MIVPTDRLVAEALAKSGLIWVSSDSGTAPVWYAHLDGVAYFVSGEGEQFSPDHEGDVNVVTRSKETRARLISFDGEATRLKPEDDDWDAATKALKAGRLNALGEDSIERWREHNPITRITPNLATVVLRGKLLDAPAEAPEETDDADHGKPDAEQSAGGGGEKTANKMPRARAERPAAKKASPTTGDKTGNNTDASSDKPSDATPNTPSTSADDASSQTSDENAKPKAPPKSSGSSKDNGTNDDSKADDA